MRLVFALLFVVMAGCAKPPKRSDFEGQASQENEAAVNVALANSGARWCDLYVTYRHKTKPDKVLIECQPYKKPVEYWAWTRGHYSASRLHSL